MRGMISCVCVKNGTREPLCTCSMFLSRNMQNGQPSEFAEAFLGNLSWISLQPAGPVFSCKSLRTALRLSRNACNPSTYRHLRSFAQSRVVDEKKHKSQPLVPGMSQYSDDIKMDAGTADQSGSLSISTGAASKTVSQEADVVSVASGSEGSTSN